MTMDFRCSTFFFFFLVMMQYYYNETLAFPVFNLNQNSISPPYAISVL